MNQTPNNDFQRKIRRKDGELVLYSPVASGGSKDGERENFVRFFKFGTVDASILMVSILAGFSFESVIARRIGAKGYGTILGAGIGNAFADTVAGLPEGKSAALGVGAGALLPLTPVFIAMALRKEFTGNTVKVAGGTSIALFVGTFFSSYWKGEKSN